METDTPARFWNRWLKADTEQRIKMVKKTLIARELAEYMLIKSGKTQNPFFKQFAARSVNDYFEDLESALKR
jgi:hypothetical protein